MDSGEGWHPPLNKTCPVCGGEAKTKHYIEKDGHIRAQYEPIDHSKELAEALEKVIEMIKKEDGNLQIQNFVIETLSNYSNYQKSRGK